MSSEYVELIQSLQLGGYIALSCFALAVYELAITLADEIRIVWRGKRNVMSILCAANRWLLLLPVINGLVGALYTSQLSLPL
ncbi:hypothetical protein PsYK624_108670 [Phanerochaete sordida]|uniref:DUF6533 domain-containing protein n=1 Tax=Phanerochaete sordida TaxID=48140 RepID=A0A9P3GH42_9APHY|nr:hypothetical protein PsYK624_108670 [Phanerochaete sordida]